VDGKFLLDILTVSNFAYSAVALVVASILAKFVGLLRDYAAEHWGRRGHFWEKTAVLAKFFIYAVTLYIIVVVIFSPSREAVLAMAGGTAVAIGFGAKNFLENIIAGIILLFERPIYVGDRIKVGHYYGDVVGINLRSTRLKTLEDSFITVPNSTMIREGVRSENAGKVPAMVVIDFYFHHKVDLELARKVLWEATVTSKYFYPGERVVILVEEERWLTHFSVKAYTADVRRGQQFRADVTTNAKKELQNYQGIYPDYPVLWGDNNG